MAGLLNGVGGLVGAGVKGLLDMAEGYMHVNENNTHQTQRQPEQNGAAEGKGGAKALDISSSTAESSPSSSSVASSAFSQMSIAQTKLVELVDVPSGWIHLQSTYLDGTNGERKVRTFGLRNVGAEAVQVEIGSDMGAQIVFWKGDDEKDMSSAASYSTTSSASNTSGTSTLTSTLPPQSTTTFYLAFTPSQGHLSTPPQPSTPSSDGGFTPRLLPALSRQKSNDASLIPIIPGSASDSASVGSSQSVAGSFKATNIRRQEPVHRAFSVHGSIIIHASVPSLGTQHVNLPFFATVCKSLFTAALIDPDSGLASGSQQSSGQMIIDFGTDSIVGKEYHRDILLVNRSEIELVWMTAVVNARYKDAAWFSLRDLDSENVFGVDTSSQPVPLPALSSRHLRLELRVKQPVPDFNFDFVISNANQSGNLVTCRAVGSGQPESTDTSLKILSGTTLDFGQITDGIWAKKLITCKNVGEKSLDIRFADSAGVEVVFRLAGVAGDDMDEDLPLEKPAKKVAELVLSRTNTRDPSRGRKIGSPASRPTSPTSSVGRASSAYEAGQHHGQLLRHGLGDSSSFDDSGSSIRTMSVSTNRDPSVTSHPLSRVASHTSSYRVHTDATESEEEDFETPFFSNATGDISTSPPAPREMSQSIECITDRAIPNQIEELAMRPGTEYRVFVLYRPARDSTNPPEIAGALRPTKFKIYIDSTPSRSSATFVPTRHTLHCSAESCTSLISVATPRIDFGEVTVGASKSTTLKIRNVSQLSAKIEIAAISKVLSTNRNVIVIPPREEVEEKMEFFPRRINELYEKQVFVRNLLNRANDQLVEIRSKNVDINNVTLHSHLYRILTPNGANFLDFGSVVVNSPTVRTLMFENLTQAPLVLAIMASQPEDVELYIKVEDCDTSQAQSVVLHNKYAGESGLERVISPSGGGDLKERFMETLRELGSRPPAPKVKTKSKPKKEESTAGGKGDDAPKQSIGAAVAAALKKGGRGRPVQLYGNAVMFKDRSLLDEHEHLDLAAGPPISAHRTSPRSKKFALLDSINSEDKAKLSGQDLPKLDFAAGAKATGLVGKDHKSKRKSQPPSLGSTSTLASTPATTSIRATATSHHHPQSPTFPPPAPTLIRIGNMPTFTNIASAYVPAPIPDGGKSPALTGKRADPSHKSATTEMFSASDLSALSVDNLLLSIEAHDARRNTAGSSWTLEEEEVFVKRTISLRKELSSLISSGKLVPARLLHIPPGDNRQLIVIMTPNGSIRPHVSTRPKRADSRLFIRLNDFDRTYLSTANASVEQRDLPVRDLIMRSNCVRSVLEVQQTSINMGNCEKGEVKSKTIVIQNKSDSIGLFRLRTSGSIASGDLKLGLGRYGVISAFGRREVENFSFTPSLVGNYQENIVIENVLDSYQDQNVAVKANVRKVPNFQVEPSVLDFGIVDFGGSGSGSGSGSASASASTSASASAPTSLSESKIKANGAGNLVFILTNTSKSERTFAIEIKPPVPVPVPVPAPGPTTPPSAAVGAGVTRIGTDGGGGSGTPPGTSGISTSWAEISISRDEADAGTALSKEQEEEVEGMLQKLKIARRKGKADKVQKYESRLTELGVAFPPATAATSSIPTGNIGESVAAAAADGTGVEGTVVAEGVEGGSVTVDEGMAAGGEMAVGAGSDAGSSEKGEQRQPGSGSEGESVPASTAVKEENRPSANGTSPSDTADTESKKIDKDKESRARTTSLTVTLSPSQKTKISVSLFPRLDASVPGAPGAAKFQATISVYEKKNTDETVLVAVSATSGNGEGSASRGEADVAKKERAESTSTSDPLHLALMRHCLALTLLCPVSPTAFCVGSTLFLPSTSKHFDQFQPHFPVFSLPATPSSTLPSSDQIALPTSSTSDRSTLQDSPAAGLILADGFSRQIPGNTHAEANALENFRNRYTELAAGMCTGSGAALPAMEDVLRETECYATMEPCSIRTSGGPSCALELVRSKVKAVYLGVEEPADFVQCEGVQILTEGGVVVRRTIGLKEECLKAARRGRA